MEIYEEGRRELLAALDVIPEKNAHLRFREGSWSVLDVLEHLVLIEKVITRSFQDALRNQVDHETKRHPVHLSARPRPVVDAPSYVVPTGRFDSIAEAKQSLGQSRQELNAVLSTIEDRSLLEKRSFPHPVFGEMQLAQWLEFIGYHEQRHIKQIEEILAKSG